MSDFTQLIDLASERLGGRVLLANDEFFAPKENLLKAEKAVFVEGQYTDHGKWMDGWETRRRRVPGHDWCIIKLGTPGLLRGVNVDTSHFKGNFPESCSIEACRVDGDPNPASLALPTVALVWREILGRTPLLGNADNIFPILDAFPASHLRLNIYPDGGVARLRVFGEAKPDWVKLAAAGGPIDLAAAENGGLVLACNDMFFGSRHNLIMPGRAANMGDGWETRRKRGPDVYTTAHDWVIVRLGRRGTIQKVEVDTNHFKGNFPDRCELESCDALGRADQDAIDAKIPWTPILSQTKLYAHTRQFFQSELLSGTPCTHVRLKIYPDGGVSRLRLLGIPSESPAP
jgi:allantoicase